MCVCVCALKVKSFCAQVFVLNWRREETERLSWETYWYMLMLSMPFLPFTKCVYWFLSVGYCRFSFTNFPSTIFGVVQCFSCHARLNGNGRYIYLCIDTPCIGQHRPYRSQLVMCCRTKIKLDIVFGSIPPLERRNEWKLLHSMELL